MVSAHSQALAHSQQASVTFAPDLTAEVFEENIESFESPRLFFFGVVCFLGVFLSLYGHKLKTPVLFVLGASLPLFLYSVKFTDSEALRAAVVLICSGCGGCFLATNPKLGLASLGFVFNCMQH